MVKYFLMLNQRDYIVRFKFLCTFLLSEMIKNIFFVFTFKLIKFLTEKQHSIYVLDVRYVAYSISLWLWMFN